MAGNKKVVPGFGLIIIGTEILSGSRKDAHFQNALKLVGKHGYEIHYSLVIPDDPEMIISKLKWAFERPEALFCFGGIGATPDDHTRQCAAKAAGLPFGPLQEAVSVIEEKYAERAYPIRVKMAELPLPCELIPNPVTGVAGFTLQKHHFLPGFPEMAKPMMKWILQNCYEKGTSKVTKSLIVSGVSEGEMVPLMQTFVHDFPQIYFFSLPSMNKDKEHKVRLGVIGLKEEAERAFGELAARLDKEKFPWKPEK